MSNNITGVYIITVVYIIIITGVYMSVIHILPYIIITN